MHTLQIAGTLLVGESVLFVGLFVFFAPMLQRILATMLALTYLIRDTRSNFESHYHRILETRTAQPILIKPAQTADEETATEHMVIDALVQQGASRKAATNTVRGLRVQRLTSFEELFRRAATLSSAARGRR